MRGSGLSAACATLLFASAATAQDGPAPPAPSYIASPQWASPVRQGEVDLYRPIDAPTPGVAIVDCAATADGRLTDCTTVEAKPAHVHYEEAGRLVATHLFRLKPQLPDGTSVAGKRVRVTVTWG